MREPAYIRLSLTPNLRSMNRPPVHCKWPTPKASDQVNEYIDEMAQFCAFWHKVQTSNLYIEYISEEKVHIWHLKSAILSEYLLVQLQKCTTSYCRRDFPNCHPPTTVFTIVKIHWNSHSQPQFLHAHISANARRIFSTLDLLFKCRLDQFLGRDGIAFHRTWHKSNINTKILWRNSSSRKTI